MNEFEILGIHERVVKAVTDLGFVKPSPIQEQAIPVLLQGNKDFVGLAQTGTGKTAAFGLPLAHLVDFTARTPQALILAPTRELCMQITNDLASFTKYIPNASVVAVYGGASIVTQISQIKRGVQIIVATPGRLLDLIGRNALKINEVRYVVLDEADEMLNMGFQDDINDILSNTPEEKQTWLFSATMPREVRSIATKFMTDPFELSVGRKNEGAENIEHQYYVVHAKDKYAALKRIVDFNPDIFGIVFCRTKIETQEIAEHLIKDGYDADSLHGDLSQQQRDKVMNRYRDKSLQLLIATDVAARGIDVKNVTHVINYGLPEDIESYTHRSGRTARAGKTGISIAIINMKEVGKVRNIERQINKKFTRCMVPNGEAVCEIQLFKLIQKVHNVEVNEQEIERFMPKIYAELNDLSKEDIIKRFASLEFNRFLEYYRKAPDLNVDPASARRDGERPSRGSSTSDRLFVNIGKMDELDVPSLIKFVANNAQIDGSSIGKIDLKGVYSFFEIDKELTEKVMKGLNGAKYNDRSVRVELAGAAEESGSRSSGGGGGYKGKRPEGGGAYGGGGGYKGGSGSGSGGGYNRDSRGGGSSRPSGGREGGGERRSGGDSGYGKSGSRPRKSY